MDAMAEYLIKIEDFPKLLTSLLKEKIVDKIIGAQTRIDKKSNQEDRFTVSPQLYEKAEGIESIEIETGKTEIIFNNSLEEIKSIIGDDEIYELVEGELSFKIAKDSDMELVKAVLEDAEIKDIEIEKPGFVSLPKLILINGMVTPLQDRPGNYMKAKTAWICRNRCSIRKEANGTRFSCTLACRTSNGTHGVE